MVALVHQETSLVKAIREGQAILSRDTDDLINEAPIEPFAKEEALSEFMSEDIDVRAMCIGAVLGLKGIAEAIKQKEAEGYYTSKEAMGALSEVSGYLYETFPVGAGDVTIEKLEFAIRRLVEGGEPLPDGTDCERLVDQLHEKFRDVQHGQLYRFRLMGLRDLEMHDVADFAETHYGLFQELRHEWQEYAYLRVSRAEYNKRSSEVRLWGGS